MRMQQRVESVWPPSAVFRHAVGMNRRIPQSPRGDDARGFISGSVVGNYDLDLNGRLRHRFEPSKAVIQYFCPIKGRYADRKFWGHSTRSVQTHEPPLAKIL